MNPEHHENIIGELGEYIDTIKELSDREKVILKKHLDSPEMQERVIEIRNIAEEQNPLRPYRVLLEDLKSDLRIFEE